MTISRLPIPALALLIVIAWALLGVPSQSREPQPGWEIASPTYNWSFPGDHWAHRGYKTEWWYFTGHLTPEGENAPRFGYQFTIFRVGLAPGPANLESSWASRSVIMGHASISDLLNQRHLFSDVLHRDIPLLGGFGIYPDSTIAWCRGPAGTAENWTLTWNGTAFDFSMADASRDLFFALSTRPKKPLIFQGPEGYSRKGSEASNASQYYSFTRLATEGTVRIDGKTMAVNGESWMDKEFGSNQLAPRQVGWDWFSLQLLDGREIMIYELRDTEGEVDFARATIVSASGGVRYLERGAWTVRADGHWQSPRTGARYPSGWTIRIPSEKLDLRVEPALAAQENVTDRSSGIYYWEGAVEIRENQEPRGRGYVELTGYGGGNRPAL